MNKSVKFWAYVGIGIIALLLILSFIFAKPFAKQSDTENNPLAAYLSEQDTIMSDMMENMTVESSGNSSLDFLKGMIPHHEAAIDMAGSYLKHGGTNDKLKELAKNIIDVQSGEIEDMQQLIKEIEADGKTDKNMEQEYLNAYNQMISGHTQMDHGTSSYSDVEHAFTEGMIMHHQMAIDMARAVLDYTDYKEVRHLAEGNRRVSDHHGLL